MSKLLKKTGRIIILLFLVVVLIVAGYFVYNNFFVKNEYSRELLISFSLTPNDTSTTILNYHDEVKLKIPRGLIQHLDTLNIYKVNGIEKPKFASKLTKVYDIDFKHYKKYSNPIDIEISFKNEIEKGISDIAKEKHLLYFDEEKKIWVDVNAEIDKDNYKIIFTAKHFSYFGITEGNVFDNPYPLMELHTMKKPSMLDSQPDINKAEKILESNTEYSVSNLATACGLEIFEEAFNLSSSFTNLSQEILGLPFVEKFNNITGELGVLFSLKQFAFEIYEGKEEEGKLNLVKNLSMYSLGKWSSQSLRIANIGLFFIDYSLTKFGEHGLEIRETKYQDIYDNFNMHHNSFRKDTEGWARFIIDLISSSSEIKPILDNEMNNYLNECFNEEGSIIPNDLREILIKKEKEKLLIILHNAIKNVREEMEEKRRRDIFEKIINAKNIMNRKLQLRVAVYSADYENEVERKKIVGLPVKVIVNRNQNFWAGQTDNAGQWWIECTWLGYLYYGKPVVVELEYNGRTLRQNIKIDNFGFKDVRFYLQEKAEKNKEEEISKNDTTKNIDIDKDFKTVTIGNQVWMAQNLNVSKFRNGDPIPLIDDWDDWKQAGKNRLPACCYYNNSQKEEKYGKMYNFFAVADPRGLAPEGWHVPTNEEWSVLFDYLGGSEVAGDKLKSKTLWLNPKSGIADEFGFSAYPLGQANWDISMEIGGAAAFWSSSDEAKDMSSTVILMNGDASVWKFGAGKVCALSVRCVKD